MALMLGVGGESAGIGGNKEVKRKWVDTSSPHGITPGTINKKKSNLYGPMWAWTHVEDNLEFIVLPKDT